MSFIITAPAAALLLDEALRAQLDPAFEPAFTAAVALVAWLCGPGCGAVSLLLSVVLFVYFFLPPYYALHIESLNAALRLTLFTGACGLIVGLIATLSRARATVARSERLYRNLSELIPFGGWISSADGQMQRLSDSFLNEFGVTMEECAGMGWTKLIIDDEQRAMIESEWQTAVRQGYFWDVEYTMRSASGEPRNVLSRGVPVTGPDGRAVSWVGIHLDITQRTRSNEERLKQARDLARFNAELEQFAYVSAHHLQEPLRSISSYLQLLERRYKGRLDSDANEFIRYAVEGANRLRTLLQDLMLLQAVGRGARPKRLCSLEDLARRALERVSAQSTDGAGAANVEIDALPMAVCDEPEVVQLFEHLLSNGLKYRKGDQRPEIRISASASSTEDGWVVSVRDNGIGIEPQYATRIFDVFQRLHGQQEYEGTGIGLAICRKIVEAHGGRIWVESAPGEGACFRFTLPEAQSPRERAPLN